MFVCFLIREKISNPIFAKTKGRPKGSEKNKEDKIKVSFFFTFVLKFQIILPPQNEFRRGRSKTGGNNNYCNLPRNSFFFGKN